MILIDGKSCAEKILELLKQRLENSVKKGKRQPSLAFILVGEHPPSEAYVAMKQKACRQVGIQSVLKRLPATCSQVELGETISSIGKDDNIDGILLQQPLPSHLNTHDLTSLIPWSKDVDGFHPMNMGRLLLGDDRALIPCTPKGIVRLLQCYELSLEGKQVVIIGRSNIVGKPLAALLCQKNAYSNATVTLCHQHTKDLKSHTKRADILIVAMGRPESIDASFVKKGVIAIDVGLSRVEYPQSKRGYRLLGDIDQKSMKQVASYLTPAPGGIGPMTIAMLMENTLQCYENRQSFFKES